MPQSNFMSLPFKTTPGRSRNMRAIKARSNATTELLLRAHLIRNGVSGWKVGVRQVPGTPDFYFKNERVAVFVDGCFWHGCPKCGHIPKTNRPYWRKKLTGNKQRDVLIKRMLRSQGVRVLRLWECRLRDSPSSCLKRLFIMLGNGRGTPAPNL